MSVVKSDAQSQDDDVEKEKRVIKHTAKGLELFIANCQKTRNRKCKQANKLMEMLKELMKSKENAREVQSNLFQLIKLCDEAKENHESLVNLPLPEDELEKQNQWFQRKMEIFKGFIQDVKVWLPEAGQQIAHSIAESVILQSVVNSDDIGPDDSVSNASKPKSKHKSSSSSRASSTSSARIKAQAEKAALMERVAALKKKHELEAQEEQLKRKKEQLELETELAATNAKINILEALGSRSSSRVSDGMNSYLRKGTAQNETSAKLNPHANEYLPDQVQQRQNVLIETNSSSQQQVVRPKETAHGPSVRPHDTTHLIQYSPQRQNVQSRMQGYVRTTPPVLNDGNQVDMCNLIQRQNDITALLAQQSLSSTLPPRVIPVYDGDPLQYEVFRRAFERGVEKKCDDYSDCLHFLEQYTRGHPKDLVRSCQHLPPAQGYQRAKDLLKEHFGNEHKIATAYMDKAFAWSVIKSEDVEALQAFSLFLRGCCTAMEHLTYMEEMNVASNMKTILLKLPYRLRDKWRSRACQLQEQRGHRARFSDLVDFIERQVKILSDPLFGNIQDAKPAATVKSSTKTREKSRPRGSSFATAVTPVKTSVQENLTTNGMKGNVPTTNSQSSCLFCNKSGHTLGRCPQIRKKMHREKIDFLKEKGVCFGCLKIGHMSKDCKSRLTCDVCNQNHPEILHIEQKDKGKKTEHTEQSEKATGSNAVPSPHTCGHIGAGDENCTFSIVPVQVKSQKGDTVLQTYAFLDHGSTSTFCTESLMRRLNITGQRTNILLRTMNQVKPVTSHHISGLEISSLDKDYFIQISDVFTHKTMPVSQLNIPRQEDLTQWPYLKDIKIHEIDSGIDLLIGTNASKVLEPWELVNSQGDGPYAVRTLLGWVIYGPLRGDKSIRDENGCPAAAVNRISIVNLEELLVKQYNHDFSEGTSKETEEMSREDVKFLDIVNRSAKVTDGHYCLDLPFTQEKPSMPNNRCIAVQRIQSLKRKFAKNKKFHDEYTSFLTEMIVNGYAEVVPVDQLNRSDGELWYIPHHGVYHSKKGTLRVVFDCGAVFKGTSLNCQLLQGPDLTNSLIGVLIRFRQEPVALMADIKAMFHQVRVSEKHVDYLRFLWWPDGDVQQDLVEYRMKVHLFGAVSSPSCANFALRKTADDNKGHFPSEVTNTVKNNFYVDDCLKSLPSEQEAVQMVRDLTALCKMGGFMLSKWISNSRAVLASIPQENRTKETKELDLDKDNLPMERALGLHWCVETDVFKFKIAAQERPYTRRGILSVVGSIYDPLGFVAPFTLPAKLIMQELCKKKLGWDENIPQTFLHRWTGWLADLNKMAEFKVDRCMKPTSFGQIRFAQLHHFSDASESGYGTASYIRLENYNREAHVAFIIGKSRVAPLKQITIPRMELTAAVLAVKVDTMLRKELQLQLDKSIFWTDSTTVLKYINNETKRFQTFVANRTSFIRDATDVSQWRYVNTKENPADEASRGLTADRFLSCKRWIQGPDFLCKPDREWPKPHLESAISANDPMDLEALTPNHLLLLKSKPILPPGLFVKEDLYIKRRWRQVQYMADLFWKRWTQEYLPLIQERQRWSKVKRSFAPGDIVVVVDSTAPRGSWLMGRILETKPDAQGLVRTVRLQTKSSILERPITKICLLQEAET